MENNHTPQPQERNVILSGEIPTVESALANPDHFSLTYNGLLGPSLHKDGSDFSTLVSDADFDRIRAAMRAYWKAILSRR